MDYRSLKNGKYTIYVGVQSLVILKFNNIIPENTERNRINTWQKKNSFYPLWMFYGKILYICTCYLALSILSQ